MELERQQRVEEPSPVSQRGSERLFFIEIARPSPRKDNYKDLKMQQGDFKEVWRLVFELVCSRI